MNRTAAIHLSRAHHHLREAALALLPPAPRKRLRTIEREWRALIVECLTDTPTDPEAGSTTSSGPRRIDIEE